MNISELLKKSTCSDMQLVSNSDGSYALVSDFGGDDHSLFLVIEDAKVRSRDARYSSESAYASPDDFNTVDLDGLGDGGIETFLYENAVDVIEDDVTVEFNGLVFSVSDIGFFSSAVLRMDSYGFDVTVDFFAGGTTAYPLKISYTTAQGNRVDLPLPAVDIPQQGKSLISSDLIDQYAPLFSLFNEGGYKMGSLADPARGIKLDKTGNWISCRSLGVSNSGEGNLVVVSILVDKIVCRMFVVADRDVSGISNEEAYELFLSGLDESLYRNVTIKDAIGELYEDEIFIPAWAYVIPGAMRTILDSK